MFCRIRQYICTYLCTYIHPLSKLFTYGLYILVTNFAPTTGTTPGTGTATADTGPDTDTTGTSSDIQPSSNTNVVDDDDTGNN